MSKQEWTKESDWFLGDESSQTGAESITIRKDPLVSSVAYFGTKANARRAYDCVMACKGIIDPRGYLLDYIPAQKRELESYIKANASLRQEMDVQFRASAWIDIETLASHPSIQARPIDSEKWINCLNLEGTGPMLFETEAERDDMLEDLRRRAKEQSNE